MASDPDLLVRMFGRFLKHKKKTTPQPVAASVQEVAVEKTKKPSRTRQRPIKQQVEKAKKIEEEEAEEFEPTPQGTRPAVCIGKRKAKINWKKDDKKEEDTSADSPPSPSSTDLQVEPLKDALAELTLEKQRLKETVERLRHRLARRDKRIEKLVNELKELKTAPKSENKGSPTVVDSKKDGMELIKQELETAKMQMEKEKEETEKKKMEMQSLLKEVKKKSEAKERKKKKEVAIEEESSNTAVATRILTIMKRNQLLEKALPAKETLILNQYFTSGEQTEPSQQVLTLLDQAIGTGIDQLVARPHELEDVIDNEMRQMLIRTNKAKTVLLEVMLVEPSFLPLAWGGRTVKTMRKEHPKKNVEKEEKKPKEGKKKEKDEKSFVSSGYFPVYPNK